MARVRSFYDGDAIRKGCRVLHFTGNDIPDAVIETVVGGWAVLFTCCEIVVSPHIYYWQKTRHLMEFQN